MQARLSKANPDGIPDLAWLDQQVIMLLRKETDLRRSLLCELEHHDLLPRTVHPVNPWCEPAFQAIRDAIPVAQVEAFVRERRTAKLWQRKDWKWVRSDRYGEEGERAAFFMEALAHSDLPLCVVDTLIYDVWWRSYRLTILQRSDLSPRLLQKCRQQAIEEALSYGQFPESRNTGPGTFYLVLRDLPEPLIHLSGMVRVRNIASFFENVLRVGHFLARLAVALRLDDSDAEQKRLRMSLVDDPNRYVRAAARKEIAWPEWEA
jgi:hypothetical protein